MASVVLKTEAAARRLGVSKGLLEKLRMTPGAGPPYVKIGRAVRYRVADLDTWAEARIKR